jgi:hypothetical protein
MCAALSGAVGMLVAFGYITCAALFCSRHAVAAAAAATAAAEAAAYAAAARPAGQTDSRYAVKYP